MEEKFQKCIGGDLLELAVWNLAHQLLGINTIS